MSKEINIKVNNREYELIKDCISLAKKHDKYNSFVTLNELYIKVASQYIRDKDTMNETYKKIELTKAKANTNLKLLDAIININDDSKYRVSYIDLNEAKVLLVSLKYPDNTLILDLDNFDDFEII